MFGNVDSGALCSMQYCKCSVQSVTIYYSVSNNGWFTVNAVGNVCLTQARSLSRLPLKKARRDHCSITQAVCNSGRRVHERVSNDRTGTLRCGAHCALEHSL